MLLMSKTTKRINKIIFAVSTILTLSCFLAPVFSQDAETATDTTSKQVTGTASDRNNKTDHDGNQTGPATRMKQGRNGFGKPMARGGVKYLAGTYDLKIEIKPGTNLEPLVVLVDGEPVDAGTAAFFLRIIRREKMRAWKNHTRTNGLISSKNATDRATTKTRDNITDTDFAQGRASSSPERIDEVMSVVRDFDPNLYSRLLQLQRVADDTRFAEEIDRLSVEYSNEIRMKQRDQVAYALKVKDRQVDTDLQTLQFEIGMTQPKDENAIDEYRQRMKNLLAAKFDIQQRLRDRELAKMQSRLQGLKQRLKKRAAEKDRYIEERTKEIFTDLLPKDQ